ncbi:late expression factor 2 [Malacosoma neustria nucleopolyhedrovirus]|uniref:late expression factor 2 n=1 Tax=Malacosoma neustria nuclear polyhedrosis virus TaxID=38012 RepID=UPI000E35CA51|nr:late expression factor 2 [Malacosoma neustria nucleopolyhedrovirus]AUF81647.1 late expression factor 2 [Malacosoma neustria nucleopolyhedrovirus]
MATNNISGLDHNGEHFKLWQPTLQLADVDVDAVYTIPVEDYPLELTPFTQFTHGGMSVRISGKRLFYLMKQNRFVDDGEMASAATAVEASKWKSKKNLCLKHTSTKQEVVAELRKKLKLPECINRLINLIDDRPLGDRYSKRFILNCYLANVVTCTKCDKKCLMNAMRLLYCDEDKCVKEIFALLYKKSKVYLPPNCIKMKEQKACFKRGGCKGANPICSF